MTMTDPVLYPMPLRDAAALRQDIARTRADLRDTLEALGGRFNVARRAGQAARRAGHAARRVAGAAGRSDAARSPRVLVAAGGLTLVAAGAVTVRRAPVLAATAATVLAAFAATWVLDGGGPASRVPARSGRSGDGPHRRGGLNRGRAGAPGFGPTATRPGLPADRSRLADQVPGPGRTDVVDLLVAEHRRIDDAFARVGALTGRARLEAFAGLVEALQRHERAEQEEIHAALAGAGAPVAARLAEEKSLARALAGLIALGAGHPRFPAALASLRRDVASHAAAEERDEFPLLRRVLPPARLRTMAARIRVIPD